jgi:hypothetical protein
VAEAAVTHRGVLSGTRALGVALAFAVTSAYAHHSFSGIDLEKTEELSGTLVRFDFSAPHSRLVMTTADSQEYQFLTGSPTQLLRMGFDPRTVHKGDKIEVTYHPTRNGSRGGQLVKMKMPDGRELVSPLEPTSPAASAAQPDEPAAKP